MKKPPILEIPPKEGPLRVFRHTSFDLLTFDALQRVKRALGRHHSRQLTNAETLRALILSHPAVSNPAALDD